MKYEELKKFTGSRYPEPFVMDGYLQATDGKALVRTPVTNTLLALAGPNFGKRTPSIDKCLWAEHDDVQWMDLPTIDLETLEPCDECHGTLTVPGMKACPECDGEGEVCLENDHNEYECMCKTCDGEGEVPSRVHVTDCTSCDSTGKDIGQENPVQIGEAHIQIRYVLRMARLAGARVGQVSQWHDPVPFVFDSGSGFVMPVRMGLWGL